MPAKLTLITPSYRITNLEKVKASINFDYVEQWIIVYDGSKIRQNPNLFHHEKIEEYVFLGYGMSGNPQRNFALTKIKNEDTYLYYLDDDTLLHENLYLLLDAIHGVNLYTFNQYNTGHVNNTMVGNDIRISCIDTGCFLCHYSLIKGIIWVPDRYEADGIYIMECYRKNKEKHEYINLICSNYNALQ
jgi:hypothetical protein